MTPPTNLKRRWTDHTLGEHLRAAGFQANEGNGDITVVLGDGHYVEAWGIGTNKGLQHAGERLYARDVQDNLSGGTKRYADAKALVQHLVAIRDRRTA